MVRKRSWLFVLAFGGLGCNFLMTPPSQQAGSADGGIDRVTLSLMTRPMHETLFPIAAGVHEKSDCNSCHGGFATFKEFTCTSSGCHDQAKTDPGHATVTGYKYNSADCLSCHPSGAAGSLSRAAHTFFPIDLASVHATSQCTDCHTNPGDRKQFTCISCHDHAQPVTDTGHAGIADYKYESASCLSCHPAGIAGTVSRPDHTTKFFPIAVTTVHGTAQCSDCHTNLLDKKQFTCISCHDHAKPATDIGHAGIANYKYDSASCLSCHPSGISGTVPRPDHMKFFPIDVGTVHVVAQCTDCHTNLKDKTQFTCLTSGCHLQAKTDPGHAAVANYKFVSASCLSCHPQGLAGTIPRADHTKFFPIDVGSKHAPQQCSDCHSNLADKTQFTCFNSGCHTQPATDPGHAAVVGYKYLAASCLTCHPQGLAGLLSRPDHAKYIPHRRGDQARHDSVHRLPHECGGQDGVHLHELRLPSPGGGGHEARWRRGLHLDRRQMSNLSPRGEARSDSSAPQVVHEYHQRRPQPPLQELPQDRKLQGVHMSRLPQLE